MQADQEEAEFDFISEMAHSFLCVDLNIFAFVLRYVFRLKLLPLIKYKTMCCKFNSVLP